MVSGPIVRRRSSPDALANQSSSSQSQDPPCSPRTWPINLTAVNFAVDMSHTQPDDRSSSHRLHGLHCLPFGPHALQEMHFQCGMSSTPVYEYHSRKLLCDRNLATWQPGCLGMFITGFIALSSRVKLLLMMNLISGRGEFKCGLNACDQAIGS